MRGSAVHSVVSNYCKSLFLNTDGSRNVAFMSLGNIPRRKVNSLLSQFANRL